MTRDDIYVLLYGICKFCEEHWMFADLADEDIEQSYRDLDKFDTDENIREGLISWLEDERDCLEEIEWSVNIVLKALKGVRT